MPKINPLRVDRESDLIHSAIQQVKEELAKKGIITETRPIVGDSQPDLVLHGPDATVAVNIVLGQDTLHFGSVVRIQDAVESLAGAQDVIESLRESPKNDPNRISGVIITNQVVDGEIASLLDRLNIRPIAMTLDSEQNFEHLADQLSELYKRSE